MTKKIMLECCSCHAATFPATGHMEYDRRKVAWFDGDSHNCHACGTALRIYVEPDYAEDCLAQVVTEARYAEICEERERKKQEFLSTIGDGVVLGPELLASALKPFANSIFARYGHPVYLVGSALETTNYMKSRDIDVVCVLPDDEFAARFGGDWPLTEGFGDVADRWTREVGKLSRTAFGHRKLSRTAFGHRKLNVDFKVQSVTWERARHKDKPKLRLDGADRMLTPLEEELAYLRKCIQLNDALDTRTTLVPTSMLEHLISELEKRLCLEPTLTAKCEVLERQLAEAEKERKQLKAERDYIAVQETE